MSAVPPTAGRSGESEGLLQLLRRLVADLPGLLSDRVHLLSLELKRAGLALGKMVVLGVVAAMFGITAWFALWIGLVAAAIEFGMPWGWAWAIALGLNLVGAFVAVKRALVLAELLKLPATMRRFTVPAPPPAPAPLGSQHDAPLHRAPMSAAQPEPRPMP